MSKFLNLIGDNEGPLTYSVTDDTLVSGFWNAERESKNDITDQTESVTISKATEDEAMQVLYDDMKKLESKKAAEEKRLSETNREIAGVDAVLGLWEPPPPEA